MCFNLLFLCIHLYLTAGLQFQVRGQKHGDNDGLGMVKVRYNPYGREFFSTMSIPPEQKNHDANMDNNRNTCFVLQDQNFEANRDIPPPIPPRYKKPTSSAPVIHSTGFLVNSYDDDRSPSIVYLPPSPASSLSNSHKSDDVSASPQQPFSPGSRMHFCPDMSDTLPPSPCSIPSPPQHNVFYHQQYSPPSRADSSLGLRLSSGYRLAQSGCDDHVTGTLSSIGNTLLNNPHIAVSSQHMNNLYGPQLKIDDFLLNTFSEHSNDLNLTSHSNHNVTMVRNVQVDEAPSIMSSHRVALKPLANNSHSDQISSGVPSNNMYMFANEASVGSQCVLQSNEQPHANSKTVLATVDPCAPLPSYSLSADEDLYLHCVNEVIKEQNADRSLSDSKQSQQVTHNGMVNSHPALMNGNESFLHYSKERPTTAQQSQHNKSTHCDTIPVSCMQGVTEHHSPSINQSAMLGYPPLAVEDLTQGPFRGTMNMWSQSIDIQTPVVTSATSQVHNTHSHALHRTNSDHPTQGSPQLIDGLKQQNYSRNVNIKGYCNSEMILKATSTNENLWEEPVYRSNNLLPQSSIRDNFPQYPTTSHYEDVVESSIPWNIHCTATTYSRLSPPHGSSGVIIVTDDESGDEGVDHFEKHAEEIGLIPSNDGDK